MQPSHRNGRQKSIAPMPTAAMANTEVSGIRRSVALGGAVRATVKNAMAHSGIASRRSITSAMSYFLGVINVLDQSPTGAYSECDARCSVSHCSLIQPRLAELTPSGTHIRGMMPTTINTTAAPTMNSICLSPQSSGL